MILERTARPTLTPVQLNRGDELRFTLTGGETRSMVLEDCHARVLLTNCWDTRVEREGGGTILEMTARVRIDGQAMTLRRYLCAQESFYEPYVVNGMRIWFDGTSDLFYHVLETHGACKPELHARFAVQDAQLPICPEPVHLMCPMDTDTCIMADAYNGDDCWMGPYRGASAHGGLDVNHPAGTPLFAPFDLDDHYYYNAVAWGHVNNRWRGVRKWPDNSLWRIQVCHIVELTVPRHTPLAGGRQFADGAGTWVGDHDHSHFIFEVSGLENECRLDAWILFWQAFEHRKRDRGEIYAAMAPLSPGRTGEPIRFSAAASRPGKDGADLRYVWTFGDGGGSTEIEPEHVFTRQGVWPVTITVDDGQRRAAFTQHITISGGPVTAAALALAAPDEPTFRNRPVEMMDVYAAPVGDMPQTLRFTARPTRPVPDPRAVRLINTGGGTLSNCEVRVAGEGSWMHATHIETEGVQQVQIAVDASGLAPGTYVATVNVTCPDAFNGAQSFGVVLTVPHAAPAEEAIVKAGDPGFYATPYFWLHPPFGNWPEAVSAHYCTAGRRAEAGEFVRFTPDLAAGTYEVRLADQTPFEAFAGFRLEAPARFWARIKHADGQDRLRVDPLIDRRIGTYRFAEGTDGYLEILSADSSGQVLADAICFRRSE